MEIERLESVLKGLIEQCEKDLEIEESRKANNFTSYLQGKQTAFELISQSINNIKEGR